VRRREFIAGLGLAAASPLGCLAVHAQPNEVPVIAAVSGGILGLGDNIAAFRNALAETGYVDGRNVRIEYHRPPEINRYELLPPLIADLIARRVALFLGSGLGAVRALKAQTTSIPVVFVLGEDPVREGLVASLNRPGGNVTGFSYFTNQLYGKRLGMLKEIAPQATAFALFVNPDNPNSEPDTKETRLAAAALGVKLHVIPIAHERDLETAFTVIVEQKIRGLIVSADSVALENREKLAALATRHMIPAIYDRREFLTAGGLMSYGANPVEAYHQAGVYAARILRGQKPADLAVQQATRIDLIINLKTAKALGLTIPETLLATADEVIQ
jgi:putative ABC transport system substrate-binding protein